MKTAGRDTVYITHSRNNEAAIRVAPGEAFTVETELCSGPWLQTMADQYEPDKAIGPNPAVVISVSGAKPGDCLAVRILTIDVEPLGYTGFVSPDNPLARLILDRDWGRNTRTLAIENGEILWNDHLRIPVRPMIGTLGTAPDREVLLNSKGGRHGGNMDVQEVTSGSTVYLPVAVPGALLHVGDVHAIQGDGEINMAGGIECRARVTLCADIDDRFKNLNSVRIENKDFIMAVACERSVEESFYAAAHDLLDWMVTGYGFAAKEAYLLMGQLMEARCTQFVNPTRSYICKMPKRYLIP